MSNLDNRAEWPLAALTEIVGQLPHKCHLRIHTCYNLVVPAHWKIESRINEDYHIVFVKSGSGSYTIGENEAVPFEKGKIIMVSRGTPHSAAHDPSDPPAIIPVRFGIYGNDTGEPVNDRFPPFSLNGVPVDLPEFAYLFEKLYRTYRTPPNPHTERLCSIAISEIVLKFLMALTERRTRRDGDPRIEQAKRYMDEHPLARCSPGQLADMAGLSEKYFRNKFRSVYGLTPLEYYARVRMEHARFLLTETGQSIKHVALTMGYPDPYSFSKQFKQLMGYPPLQLKSAYKEPQG